MREIGSTDQPDEPAPTPDNLLPRPRTLNRPLWRAGPSGRETLLQSPPTRAIRPISCDCNERALRPLPFPGRPSRGSNLFSLSGIREDMRAPETQLKYLASQQRKSAVLCVEEATQSLWGGATETDSLPEKRCADKYIAQNLRSADFRFILPYTRLCLSAASPHVLVSLLHPGSIESRELPALAQHFLQRLVRWHNFD